MYFKVNPTGCNERKGLVEVRYDLYLDPTDYGYPEHYVQVPVMPEGGYPGKVDAMVAPVDQEDYAKWFAGLERAWQNNPFCCHFCQFEPEVTDEEILFVGELALDMAYKNWQAGDLHKNKNEPVQFIDAGIYREIAKPFVEMTKDLAAKGKALDYDGDPVGVLVDAVVPAGVDKALATVKATDAVAKIQACEVRVAEVIATDFETLKVA